MQADVKLTGYDKRSEYLSVVLDVPVCAIDAARHIAGVPATDPDILGVYPLTEHQAAEIAAHAELQVEPDKFDYCLEAIAHDDAPRARTA